MNKPPVTLTRRRISHVSLSRMIVAMLDRPCTVYELADETGLHVTTVRLYVKTMHREGGAYVAMWEKDKRGADTTAAYQIGSRRDAPKQYISDAKRAKAYRAKLRDKAAMQALAGVA